MWEVEKECNSYFNLVPAATQQARSASLEMLFGNFKIPQPREPMNLRHLPSRVPTRLGLLGVGGGDPVATVAREDEA